MKRIIKILYEFFILNSVNYFSQKKSKNKAILIFSCHRSGSTWLMNILSNIEGALPLFEPFNPIKNPSLFQFMIGHKVFKTNESFKAKVDGFIQARYLNRWMTSHTSLKKIFISNFTIVKILRVNYVIDWFCRNYKNNKKIILFRHPGAVVSSALRASKGISRYKDVDFNERSIICNNIDISELLKNVNHDYERILINWCIENVKLYNNISDCHAVFYENLLLDSKKTIENLFNFLQVSTSQIIFDSVNKRSLTSNIDSSLNSKNPIERWKLDFNKEEIDRMQEILIFFNINFYNMKECTPILNLIVLVK